MKSYEELAILAADQLYRGRKPHELLPVSELLLIYLLGKINMGEIADLKGLGLRSEKILSAVGIITKDDLVETGAVGVFLQVKKMSSVNPSLNLLYALVGAIEDKHWVDIAREEKSRLLLEVDGYEDLARMLKEEGIEI